jgi:t-SNARE complex subunit (syntaxin)
VDLLFVIEDMRNLFQNKARKKKFILAIIGLIILAIIIAIIASQVS